MTEDREHLDDENNGRDCWCKPDLILELDGRELWVHHGLGEELPPAKLIAESVYDLLMNR